jgi:serine/threonine protein phosphatase PrpC
MRCATKQVPCGQCTEDRVTLLEVGRSCLIVVAYGVGGLEFGDRAAELVVGVIEESWRESHLDCPSSIGQRLREADTIAFHSSNCGQTSAVVVAVIDGSIFGASVGDSEAWLITDHQHSALTSSQHSRPLLGSGKAEPVTFCRKSPGGVLLVGSDGLFRRVPSWLACDTCRINDPPEACEMLVQLARLPDGKFSDDVSVVVYRFPSTDGT